VAAIIAHETSFSCKCDGTNTTEQEHNSKIMQDLNSLRHLGYLGWPGAMPVVDNHPVLFFSQIVGECILSTGGLCLGLQTVFKDLPD
jgi:hypothetical protein